MAPLEPHTFLFADIAGYSLLTELDGDEAAADLAMRFVSEASSIACDHGAEVVKALGDAVMVHADDADRAVRLALDLLTKLGRDQLMLPIHAGLHTGPAVGRMGDWWGATVNIAARLAAAAGPGQVLLTEATRAAAGEMDSIRPARARPAAPEEHHPASQDLRGVSRTAGTLGRTTKARHRRFSFPLRPRQVAVDQWAP
jgi:class 3 adenylate cyclase